MCIISSGNKRQEQAEQTKNKILEAAKAAFAENGYKGTSVRSINRNIGQADGLLYHYFSGGKKELFQTIVNDNAAKISAELLEMQNSTQLDSLNIEEMLAELFMWIRRIVSDNLDILRIIVRESEVRTLISTDILSGLLDECCSWFADMLKRRADSGEIRQIDFESASLSMRGIVINYIAVRVLDMCGEGSDSEENFRRMIHYQADLWRGI